MFPLVIEDAIPNGMFYDLYDEIDPKKMNNWVLRNVSYTDGRKTSVDEHVSWKMHDNTSRIPLYNAGIHLKYKISKEFYKTTGRMMDLTLCRVYSNGQTSSQATSFHTDYDNPCYYTAILFSEIDWDSNWGGEFTALCPETNHYHIFPYIPNNAIVIPGCWEHKGNAPQNNTDRMRTTIAFSYYDLNTPYKL